MKLFEHPEFEQIVLRTAAATGQREQFVEKDYYVTEILRIVADKLGAQSVFKGGTSLSKGWGLIRRFSEDIDLFIDPSRFTPALGKKQIDRILKDLSRTVDEHPAFTWLQDEGDTKGGLSRADYFAYRSRFDALPGVRGAVRLEPGVQSGDFPTEVVSLSSLIGTFLREQELDLGVDDLARFDMTLLHFRRTFVEKLFTVHSKVMRLLEEGVAVGRDTRHYADLYELAGTPEVLAMLESVEYEQIVADYDEKSRAFYPKSYRPPDGLSFGMSPALFPPNDLRETIEADYEEQCRLLFADDSYPPFADVMARFATMRPLLAKE